MDQNIYFPTVADIEKASAKLEEIIEPTPYQYNAHFSEKYKLNLCKMKIFS